MNRCSTRQANAADAPEIATLVNLAYRVEDFFKIGDRTDRADVERAMEAGPFLVLTNEYERIVGCIHVEVRHDRGYFGMLSVLPESQRQGLGHRLIAEAEDHCRLAGCEWMDLEVVNLRDELPAFYRSLGYVVTGTAPFPAMERTKLPCHFIVMSKPLVAEGGTAEEALR